MKIAFATEDGKTISQHFGRAPYYLVLTVEDGRIVQREQREKASHAPGEHHHAAGEGQHAHPDEPLHNRMAAAIKDCQVMVVRGMGRPAYENVKRSGIQPILTDIATIDQAAEAYLAGTLADHTERLH